MSNQNINRQLWKQIFFTAENLRKNCIPKNDDSFVKLTLRQLHFIRTIHLESEGQEKGVSLKKLAKTLEITEEERDIEQLDPYCLTGHTVFS